LKYYDQTAISSRAESRAYQIKGTRIAPQFVRLTQGIIPPAESRRLAAGLASTVRSISHADKYMPFLGHAAQGARQQAAGSRSPFPSI
jgi:hypothetical protein